jgi:hypothetical protein
MPGETKLPRISFLTSKNAQHLYGRLHSCARETLKAFLAHRLPFDWRQWCKFAVVCGSVETSFACVIPMDSGLSSHLRNTGVFDASIRKSYEIVLLQLR